MNTIYLPYRGQITGLVSAGSHAAFISAHNEKQATALYRLDASAEKITLSAEPLASGATALVSNGKTLWFVSQDGKLYQAPLAKGKPKAITKLDFSDAKVIGLALLADNHLAVLQQKQLNIVDIKSKTITQQLPFNSTSNVLASSSDGLWLSVGYQKGDIQVYQWENNQLNFSAEAKIHQGAVTALQFEANELRFYSAGSDKKLFNTHAQGELQPLDKGRNSNHAADIKAILLGQERFFTGANDKSIKAWPLAGGQPVTLKQGLRKITALSHLQHQDRPCLLVAGTDNSLRIVGLSSDDKFTEIKWLIEDGYALAKYLLKNNQAAEREKALSFLADYDDKQALDIIAKHLNSEKDRATREKIVALVSASKHAQSTLILESLLNDKSNEKVRQQALKGLLARAAKDDLRPYEKVLETKFIDTATIALQALAKIAKKEPRAEQLLFQGLQHSQATIRLLTLSLLEGLYGKSSPKASLIALKSSYSDLQRAALIRLYQRNVLNDPEVKQVLLLTQEAQEPQLRHTAFLVSILSQKTLSQALKTREPDLARQLQELEDFDLLDQKTSASDNKKSAMQGVADKLSEVLKKKQDKPRQSSLKKMTDEDYGVLLQGMINSHADICFTATLALSVLKDQRAYGMLLSLSQEEDAGIRAGVARAFAWLEQEDSVQSLEVMLNDKEAIVRDAAFSALVTIQNNALETANYGFNASQQDIHARALKVLLDVFSGKMSKALQKRALDLLNQALNDPFEAIRKETFKACLNRQLAGDEEQTLKLLLQSEYENIHQEVLNELMAKSKVLPIIDWVEPLLLSLFENNFSNIRLATFNFISREKKRFERQTLLANGVVSSFEDVRWASFKLIKSKPSKESQQHLKRLLDDKDESLREQVLVTLIEKQNSKALIDALQSPHDDVKINAAYALARWKETKSFAVLNDYLQQEQPHKKHEKEHWYTLANIAMQGLASLGDTRAVDTLLSFINEPKKDKQNKALATHAAQCLPFVVESTHLDMLQQLQQDERKDISALACFASALLGDKSSKKSFLKQAKTIQKRVGEHNYLAALITIEDVSPLSLLPHLESYDTHISSLLIFASYELLQHGEAPYLSSWALSLANTELKLFSTGLLACYSDEQARWEYVKQWLESKQKEQGHDHWEIAVEDLQTMAKILVYGSGHLKAYLIACMSLLNRGVAIKSWQLSYQGFLQQRESLIEATLKTAEPSQAPKDQQTLWNQKVVGAYLGIIRQDNDLGARLKALTGLVQLAQKDVEMQSTVSRCLLTLLNHDYYDIRQGAFEQLQALKTDTELLGRTAISLPKQDIAEQGLSLLIAHYPAKKSQQLLQELITGQNYLLANEAYRLLVEDIGLFKAAPYAIKSIFWELRKSSIQTLAANFSDKKAQDLLLKTSKNVHVPTATLAAKHLAKHQHKEALPALQALLDHNQDQEEQRSIIQALKQLKTEAVASCLYNYLCNNALNRQPFDYLYSQIASYRPKALFDDLLIRLEHYPKEATAIIKTLLAITGYDQSIDDFDDKRADQTWLEKQFPRQDDLLLTLFNALIKRGDGYQRLWQAVAWAKDPAIDQALIDAVAVIDEKDLSDLITVIAHRAEKRDGSVEGLLKVLSHKDADVQFLAAEGLAKNGHKQGFAVLFAAIDYQENDDYRQRAVLALGKSGDTRALDKLLKLAQDKEHFLHEVAIEAIGHLGNSEDADKIFKLIKTGLTTADYYSDKIKHALNGLRWFNTLAAWQLICAYIEDDDNNWSNRQHAVSLLQYWESEATRTLLIKLLKKEEDEDVVETAFNTAKLIWKPEENTIDDFDYALLTGLHPNDVDYELLTRITQYATTAQLLSLLGEQYEIADEDEEDLEEILQAIGNSLLTRSDYTAKDISNALDSNDVVVMNVLAVLITRLNKLSKAMQTKLEAVTESYYQRWLTLRKRLQIEDDWELRQQFKQLQQCIKKLLWANVHHNHFSERVLLLLANQQADLNKDHYAFQIHLLKALLSKDKISNKAVLACLDTLLQSVSPEVNLLANQLIAKHKKSADLQWDRFISQPKRLMAAEFEQPLKQAASESAHQAQVLPILISKGDIETLNTIANDATQQEPLRIGAIEGLARILNSEAENALKQLHQDLDDKDLNKSAYRALRRQQRARQKAQNLSQLASQQGASA